MDTREPITQGAAPSCAHRSAITLPVSIAEIRRTAPCPALYAGFHRRALVIGTLHSLPRMMTSLSRPWGYQPSRH
jgi:hypothetical protein